MPRLIALAQHVRDRLAHDHGRKEEHDEEHDGAHDGGKHLRHEAPGFHPFRLAARFRRAQLKSPPAFAVPSEAVVAGIGDPGPLIQIRRDHRFQLQRNAGTAAGRPLLFCSGGL